MNNILGFKFALLLSLLLFVHSKTTYHIKKNYVGSRQQLQPISMGKLIMLEAGTTYEPYVEPQYSTFIDQADFESSQMVILEFVEEQTKKTYKTSVIDTLKEPHGQKFDILMSPQGQIISINYAQTLIIEDIRAQIFNPQQGKKHTFVLGKQEEKQKQEDSFFSKYKWPLIIGGIVLYMSMSMDPEKMQQMQQQQAQRQ